MNQLYVDSVTKEYGHKQVLTDVFLTCAKGEIIGLLGRNGSGKSTLLKIIFGAIPADNKFIRIGNTPIRNLWDNRRRINYLPQFSFLPGHLKVSTLISLFCDKTNCALVGSNQYIQPLINKRVGELSGGELRLVEIFMIVHSEADYVLIDEPFNGIAPLYREVIKELIKRNTSSKGFIITDHDYRNILDISTRIILMDDGGTKQIKEKEELKFWKYIPADY